MKKEYNSPKVEIEMFNVLSNVFTITLSLMFESEYKPAGNIKEGKDISWD